MRFHDWLFFPGQRVILHHLNVRFHTKHIMSLHCLPYCGMPFKAMPSTKTGPLYSMAGVLLFCHGSKLPLSKLPPTRNKALIRHLIKGQRGGRTVGSTRPPGWFSVVWYLQVRKAMKVDMTSGKPRGIP